MFAVIAIAVMIICGLICLLLYIVREKRRAEGLTKVLVTTGTNGIDLEMKE